MKIVRRAIWGLVLVAFVFVAREFPVIAAFAALVAGLAGVVYLICARRSMSPLQPEREREKHYPGAW